MSFEAVIELVGKVGDAAGVAAVVLGIALASVRYVTTWRRTLTADAAYRAYRTGIGRAILLGLELLVASDIIRTVAISPTFESVGVLAVIVLVRTFLSFSLQLELEGRLPWQPPRDSPATTPAPRPDGGTE